MDFLDILGKIVAIFPRISIKVSDKEDTKKDVRVVVRDEIDNSPIVIQDVLVPNKHKDVTIGIDSSLGSFSYTHTFKRN